MRLFRVIAEGKDKRIIYEMIDYYDEKNNVSAMARTTGYTALVIATFIYEGIIRRKGLFLPEELGMDEKIFSKIIEGLEEIGIRIEIKEEIIKKIF
jgi:lysine 6-dehydrogenase